MTKNHQPVDRLGFAALTGVIIAWAMGPLFVRFFSTMLDPWMQNALRYSSAAVVLLPIMLRHYRGRTVSAADWRHAAMIACLLVTMQSCWTGGIYYINPGFSSILGRLSLLWICLLSFILFPEDRHLLKKSSFWIGAILSFIGVAGVIGCGKNFALTLRWHGIILIMCSSICWAGYSVAVKYFFRKLNLMLVFSMICLTSLPLFWLLVLLFGNFSQLRKLTSTNWLLLVISAVICISMAHILYHTSTKRIGLVIPVLLLSINPFVILTISHFIFGETINLAQLISGTVLIGGSLLATLSKNDQDKIMFRKLRTIFSR